MARSSSKTVKIRKGLIPDDYSNHFLSHFGFDDHPLPNKSLVLEKSIPIGRLPDFD